MFSHKMTSRTFVGLMLLVLTLLGACTPGQTITIGEEDEPDYKKGESLMRENRLDEALLSFEKVIDARRDCPETHLELGRIYMDHVKDPISAIYHFRKYLELKPNPSGSDKDIADKVGQLIESCKKDFARSLPGDPFGESVEHIDVLEQMKSLRQENDELRRTVAALQSQQRAPRATSALPALTSAPAAQPPVGSNGTRSYTVRPGDTLSKISTAVYGNPSRWQEIYSANRNQLKNPHDLHVGMTLTIPQ